MAAKGFVILTLVFRKEGNRWTGECLELGTATYGRSLEKTHSELAELVELHLNALEQAGERQHFFKAHNIRFYADHLPPAKVNSTVPVDESSYVHFHSVSVPVGAYA